MVDRLALIAEARGAVRHQPFALRGADGGTKIGLAAQAAFALAAFRRVERNHVIAGLDRRHARPYFADDARALMTEDRRKDAFAVESIKRVGIGVADSGRLYLDENLTSFWAFKINLNDFERLLGFERDSSAGLHLKLHFFFSSRCTDLPERAPRMFGMIIWLPCRTSLPQCRRRVCLHAWQAARARRRHKRGPADRHRGRPCSRRHSGYRRTPA